MLSHNMFTYYCWGGWPEIEPTALTMLGECSTAGSWPRNLRKYLSRTILEVDSNGSLESPQITVHLGGC